MMPALVSRSTPTTLWTPAVEASLLVASSKEVEDVRPRWNEVGPWSALADVWDSTKCVGTRSFESRIMGVWTGGCTARPRDFPDEDEDRWGEDTKRQIKEDNLFVFALDAHTLGLASCANI